MTASRDRDRILRAWLDLMPDEAPDRAVAAVLQAIETTPQARRTLRWLTWRLIPMNRVPVVIATAVVVAVAGIAILLRSGAPGNVAASPSAPATGLPAASASGAASAAAVASSAPELPTEIQARWMSSHRTIVGGTAGTTMLIGASGLQIAPANSNGTIVMTADAAAAGTGRLELASSTASGGCGGVGAGSYRWTIGPTGRSLTITAENDPCADRVATVPGLWWLMGCADPGDNCLGVIDAGAYQSQFIAPRIPAGATWAANYGSLSYRVPNGWANGADWPETFSLVPTSDYPPPNGSDPARSIVVLTHPTAISQAKPCSGTVDDTVGTTVPDLVAWLRKVPGLISSAPTSATIDGHPAKVLDLRVDPSWTPRCAGETEAVIEYLKVGQMAVVGSERQRLYLIDLGKGDVVGIVIRVTDPARFDDFVAEALPIVESFKFQ